MYDPRKSLYEENQLFVKASVNASVIMVCTAEHCGFHYLNKFCLYVANCFVTEIVDLCTDQDAFAWYVSAALDFRRC